MNIIRNFFIWAYLLASASVSAQQQPPALHVPHASTPPIAVFIAWHESLLRNNFIAYKNATIWPPEIKKDIQKQLFDFMRNSTPKIVKITDQKQNPNGSISFYAVGCKDARRLINSITVGNINGVWLVSASGWGPPWNETAKMCPI